MLDSFKLFFAYKPFIGFTSHKLVFVSFIAFICFLIISFILKTRKKLPLYLVILSSFLPLVSLLRRGVYQSGDFAINIEKSIDLWRSLTYGIFPVHWASILNATYGYPLFLFTYPLPYYSIAFIKLLGFSFISSEKIVIAMAFILSGLAMYLLTKEFLKPLPASVASILYLFAPYHLVDMHFRIALGETFAYAFLPFVFYFIIRLLKQGLFRNFFFLTISFLLLVLSHQAITIVSVPFIFALPLFIKGKKSRKRAVYVSLACGALLSAFYWLPAVIEINYTHQIEYAKSISFENFWLYFFSPWRYGFLYQGPIGQISFTMGFVQIFLFLLTLFFLKTKKIVKTNKRILKLLIIIFSFLLFLLLPISLGVWRILPLMTNFQFAYRLMLPISFILAIIGGISVSYINKKSIIYLLIFIAILTTILNWGHRAMIDDMTDTYLIQHVPLSTYEGEGLQPASPKWRDINNIWVKTIPKAPITIVSGNAIINQLTRTPIVHKYQISVMQNADFVENTFFFPGWTLYVNGKPHPFSYEDKEKSDLIHFNLSKGTHDVVLRFEDTNIVKLSNALSVLSLLSLVGFSLYQLILHKRR